MNCKLQVLEFETYSPEWRVTWMPIELIFLNKHIVFMFDMYKSFKNTRKLHWELEGSNSRTFITIKEIQEALKVQL